jgi:hypothetical protein
VWSSGDVDAKELAAGKLERAVGGQRRLDAFGATFEVSGQLFAARTVLPLLATPDVFFHELVFGLLQLLQGRQRLLIQRIAHRETELQLARRIQSLATTTVELMQQPLHRELQVLVLLLESRDIVLQLRVVSRQRLEYDRRNHRRGGGDRGGHQLAEPLQAGR